MGLHHRGTPQRSSKASLIDNILSCNYSYPPYPIAHPDHNSISSILNYQPSSSYYMASSLQHRLREAEERARIVQESFHNNLQVIEEQEQEIAFLSQRVTELEQQNQSFRMEMDQMQEEREFQARLARNQVMAKQEEHEKEVAEVAALIEAKYRRELEGVSQRKDQQLKAVKSQLQQRDESSRRMLQENSRLIEVINDLKERQLDLEQQVTSLIDEKKAMSSKMALHEQQLQGIRLCNSNWEESLKQKIKDAQEERQRIEEQFAEYKLAAKEKLRRQKEDLARSIAKLTEESQKKYREAVFQHKQLQFNFDKVQGQLREKTKELQLLRDERKKLESTINKYDEHQRAFSWNEKQRNQLQQMLEQQKKDTKLQLDSLGAQLKKSQQQFEVANKKREDAEKAVQRLRVELLNKAKETDELKKTVAKLQYKAREYQQQAPVQPQIQPQIANSYKQFDRMAYDSKGFGIAQSARIEEDYSKVYTDDPGVIDSRFFDQTKSPKHNPNNNKNFSNSPKAQQRIINREAQLMKQVGQLQLQLQDCKAFSKRYLEQTESLRKTVEERNRELSLIKDKVNLYWEKANDKEQQVNGLKEMNSELKTSYNQISQQLKKYRQLEAQWRAKQQEFHSMKEKVHTLQKEMKEMQEQIDMITKDRDLMEQISSDLRADNHNLREILAGNYEPQQDQSHSFSKSHHEFTKSQQDIRHPQPKEQETVPIYQLERQRFPKKLHDLVREKKMLSISGKRAAMEERAPQARLQQIHAGTDSQKEVLQRIKQKNKTPPKIANYAQMKKQKQRRTQQLETVSQKQVFQRLKSRQNSQNMPQSPQKGVNYLLLRQMGAQ